MYRILHSAERLRPWPKEKKKKYRKRSQIVEYDDCCLPLICEWTAWLVSTDLLLKLISGGIFSALCKNWITTKQQNERRKKRSEIVSLLRGLIAIMNGWLYGDIEKCRFGQRGESPWQPFNRINRLNDMELAWVYAVWDRADGGQCSRASFCVINSRNKWSVRSAKSAVYITDWDWVHGELALRKC